jgi:NCAIR mutase (PurE)-related protein
LEIVKRLLKNNSNVLITRVTPEQIKLVKKHYKKAVVHDLARCITIEVAPIPKRKGKICILCAGTSDIPVAEEAAVTADIMGNVVEKIYDVGVAGIHRLLRHLPTIQQANVIIVVAGMEGALASVVAGLVAKPVIAVPTSVGYGANLGGLTTLLAMLNSCASGVTVVNIDNGFGAAYAASQINALA